MSISSRSAVAVHILGLLAFNSNEAHNDACVTSETLAGSVRTNPVVIRRILGALREANLVNIQPGVGGGARLARRPDQITILDIYRAVEKDELFNFPEQRPDPSCPIGPSIHAVMDDVFAEAQAAMEAALGGVTLDQVMHAIMIRTGDHADCSGAP